MPWVVVWMGLVAALAALSWGMGHERRAAGLLGVLCALPATFHLYTLTEVGPLWAGLVWVVLPVYWLWFRLRLRLPAILGEATALPYIAYSLGWAPEWPAQAAADVFGLAMVASLGGPAVVDLAGRIADDRRAGRRARDLAPRHADHPEATG